MKHSRNLLVVTSLLLLLALLAACQRLSPSAELDSVLEARNRPQQLRLR